MMYSKANLFVVTSFAFLMASVASTTFCQTLNKKMCRKDASCLWNRAFDVCIDASEKAGTSEKPTNQPTRQPTVTGLSNCPSLVKRRKCKRDSLCMWDDNSGVCVSSGSTHPTSSPTSSPTKQPSNGEPTDVANNSSLYKTCFQRAIDPSNNLTEDTILRDHHKLPYISPEEELTNGTLYVAVVRNNDTDLTDDDQLDFESTTLSWLRVSPSNLI
jgi:hypothetical protein